jgi:hypothetical protein
MNGSALLSEVALAGLVAVALFVVVFLIVRGFWLWYWRVDELVHLLREIAKNTQLVEERGRPLPAAPAPAAPAGVVP